MIPIPTSLLEAFSLPLFIVFFILFFLPAIFELKRPKDVGPRRIANMGLNDFAVNKVKFDLNSLVGLDDIEEGEFMERRLETVTMPVRNPIFVLANIEV